jgi:ribosomal protein S18 acetylase RimI-like enzyme
MEARLLTNDLKVIELTEIAPDDLHALANLLIEVVETGASIGFLPPLSYEHAVAYWNGVLAPDVNLWVAYYAGELVGAIQLNRSTKQNGTHRAEIAKLMVHPTIRRKGIARQLMHVAEQAAVTDHRSLMLLDTRAGDPSNDLYQSLGYLEAGRIPHYARSADGKLDDTVFYYKLLVTE